MSAAASKPAVAARAVARGPQASSTAPVECAIAAGTAWHSVHATGAASVPPARCAWCAPTARVVVATSRCVPRGGAGDAAEPWHELHVSVASSLPSMCSSAFTEAGP